MSFDQHIEALTDFATGHLTGDEAVDRQLRVKLTHSLKVLDNANAIIEGESITGRNGELCRLAALYHDIGRFPQFAKYKTFNDRESTNHARLGVLTLRDLSLPGSLSPDEWRTVRFAVAQHNVKTIRPTLPDSLATPTQVVRDADKVDIFRVMIEHFSGENPDPVVTHGFDDIPDRYSEEIYASVLEQRIGDYRHITCANDFKLLIIGWIYGLHFPTSIKLLFHNGSIDHIFSFLPNDEKIQALATNVNEFIRYNIDKHP